MRAFLDAYAPLIRRLAHSAVRRETGVEPDDVAQEIVLCLLQLHERGRFDPDSVHHPEAYLRVVVRHAAYRAKMRRQGLERLTADGDLTAVDEGMASLDDAPVPTPEDHAMQAVDARRRLDGLKAQLRPRDAVAFALLVEDGLDIQEVAVAMGTTVNNVYQMRHRILAVARDILGKEGPPPSLLPPAGALPVRG